jgi:hypothetical protein
VSHLRRRVRPFSVVRQRWFLGAAPGHEALTFDDDDATSMALEELGRFTWMLIAACVVLFIASLPGGMFTIVAVSTGIVLATSGRVAYMRALRGPQPRLDPELIRRGAARQLVQAKLMHEAFGEGAERGRKLEEVEIAPQRRWLLLEGEEVIAVLFEMRDEGFVLVRGEILCTDLQPGQDLPKRWRLELLPQTGRILAWTGLGGEAPAREVECDALTANWIAAQGEFSTVDAAMLPAALARGVGAAATPYRA